MGVCLPDTILLQWQDTNLRGNVVAPFVPSWPGKDTSSTVVRSVDFREVLGTRTITGVACVSDTAVVAGSFVLGSVVSLILQGGTAGTPARVEIRALCSDGTDEAAAVLLPIQQILTLPEGEQVPVSQTAITVGATPGLLGPLPVFAQAGASVAIRGFVLARNAATSDTVTWDVAATVKQFGTVGAAVEQQSIAPFTADAALRGCALALAATGSAISFVLTGTAGVTLTWSSDITWAIA